MKKLSRLAQMVLVLALLLSVCTAAQAVDLDSLDRATWKAWEESNEAITLAASRGAEVVGKKALTNVDNVWIYEWASLLCPRYTVLPTKGTEVTILGEANQGLLGHFYKVEYTTPEGKVVTGYTETRQLDVVPEPVIPPVTYEPWNPEQTELAFAVTMEGAASYQWERGLIDENGDITWEVIEGATEANLTQEATPDNLKYVYRCIGMDANGEAVATSEEITLVREDLVQWMNAREVTEEMLVRAMNAESIESIVVEGDQLIYVNTGEPYATYDAQTGIVTHKALNIPFAVIENGEIKPISPAAGAAE